MPHNIDFSALSLRDALDLAILIEDEAAERYEEFVVQLSLHDNNEAACRLLQRAWFEGTHERMLQRVRQSLFGDEPRRVTRGMLFNTERSGTVEAGGRMTVRQALEVVRDTETAAYAFYDVALRYIDDADVRDCFTQLRSEELADCAAVEAQLAVLSP